MYKIAVIEDDPGTRAGLVKLIESYEDLTCLLAAGSMPEFWERVPPRATFDLVFVDIDLPGQSGLEGLPTLRKRYPDTELIIYTHSDDSTDLLKALHLGATGYLLKDFPLSEFRKHIDTILGGGAAMSAKMARKLIDYLGPQKRAGSDAALLGTKEERVITLLAEGNTYEETAAALGTSVNAVKYHIKNIYRKLGAENRMDAIRIWKRGQ